MRNLKLNATAAGIALALSGTANAVIPGVQTEIFMSGASAPSNMLRENIVQNACDQAQSINVYVDFIDQVPGGGDPTLADPIVEHRTFWAVECTAKLSSTGITDRIAFYKTDAGGSGNGTTPILLTTVPLEFMDANATNCTLSVTGQKHGGTGANAGTYNLYECLQDDLVFQTPDVGVSDIEASKFVGKLAPTSGDFTDPNGYVEQKVGPGLIFGPIVTTGLRDELRDDQMAAVPSLLPGCVLPGGAETVACMPSIPSAVVRSITVGKYNNWSDVSVYGQTVNVPSNFIAADPKAGNIHLCRRVQGSGTHAEYLIHYHRTNCYVDAQAILNQPGAGAAGLFGGPLVYENSSSGTLGSCLDALDTGGGLTSAKITPDIAVGVQSFGFGYQSTEKNMALAKNFRYVKVDGIAPTLANAVKGDYRQIYYSGFQNRINTVDGSPRYRLGTLRTVAVDAAKVQALFDKTINISSSIVNVLNTAFVHGWGAAGFLVPDANAPTDYIPGDPRTPWTRENSSKADSCQPLFIKKL